MKMAIIGSRTFDDYKRMKRILDLYPITTIISGQANGADSLGERYADEKGIKKAGFIRNTTIIENCDMVVAFWDAESKGTKDSLDKAQSLKKTTLIAYF